jgi:cellulose synthase/poly-beta-1,6-N-acetylglucosamine synthase-like glycosyltransferase
MSFFTLFGWFIALFWLWHGGVVIHFLHGQQLNKRIAHLPPLTQYPKLSIIVPARDEQQAIRATLTSLLALDYPNFEVLAIDDRSRDATGAIMDELQAHSPRLKVIHVTALPEGWLGKNHAMHLAAQQAVGDYLLFTDGDVIYAAETLKQAMQVVMAQHWDHFALMPRLLPGDYAENSVLQFMGLAFIIGTYPFLVANPNSRCFAGVGSFNLIRRGCYWHIGGFENLRLEVVEDMALGREVKRQGFRSQLLFAEHLLQVRWQQKVSGLVHGIEKNSFAAIDYSLTNLFALTVVFKTVFFLPYVAVFVLPMPVALGYGVALVLLHSLLAYMGARAKVGWQISFALPFSAAVTLWAVWRSAFLTLKQGGIYWRDTFYPLALLKSKIPPAAL